MENERYEIVSKAGVLATDPPRAVVYLEGDFPKPAHLRDEDGRAKESRLRTQVCSRSRSEQRWNSRTHDDTYHNIFSYSPAKRFDLGRYPPDENPTPSVVFDKPGLVTLRCDIHEHMRGLILVLKRPTSPSRMQKDIIAYRICRQGISFSRPGSTAGTTLERPVELKAGAALRVNLP